MRFRLSLAFLLAAFGLLVDEYVKEGYVFDVADVFRSPLTHEQLFIVFLALGLFLGLRRLPWL
jgi:fructose 1,6-bisphosphatase